MTTYMKDSKAPPRARGKPLECQKAGMSEGRKEEESQEGTVISIRNLVISTRNEEKSVQECHFDEEQELVPNFREEISPLKEIPLPKAFGIGMTSPPRPTGSSGRAARTSGGSKPAVTWVKPPGGPGGNTPVTVPPTTGLSGGRLLLFRTSLFKK